MADKFTDLVKRYEQARLRLEELLASDPDPSVEEITACDREITESFEKLTQTSLNEKDELYSRIVFLLAEIDRLSIESNLTRQLCNLITSDLSRFRDFYDNR